MAIEVISVIFILPRPGMICFSSIDRYLTYDDSSTLLFLRYSHSVQYLENVDVSVDTDGSTAQNAFFSANVSLTSL